MSKIQAQTLKGFRDFLPEQASVRSAVAEKIISTFQQFGFEPLETPALEYAETLKGKYGDEEKLIYEFTTKGGDQVALRYDQTVPLARVIAEYQNELIMPFKRYQIQPVWRGENTQKGRYREFLQCDADIIGVSSPLADSEILSLVLEIYKNLGLNVTIKINDRNNFTDLDKKYISAIDKLEKIGESGVLEELQTKGMTSSQASEALETLQEKPMTDNLKQILEYLEKMGQDMSKVKYEPTLARGLDYYTGMIFETVTEAGGTSLCSGGRWDKMIGNFTGIDLPAVGFGLGFDRTIEALQQANLLPAYAPSAKVLVCIFNEDLVSESIKMVSILDENKINSELWLDPSSKLDKQLKYADQKQIPYAIIIGPEEVESKKFALKDLKNKTQATLTLDKLIDRLA
ncbi:MAG: histidine--tRNA ligase [Candidatus Daviesbacteria bacterium]|nr:histidine--tRNA ligase [Candidatus Daviesbacteria bacterium]